MGYGEFTFEKSYPQAKYSSNGNKKVTPCYSVDRHSGLLTGAIQSYSPNQGVRADPADISLLVVHNISLPPGEFGSTWIEDFFQNKLDKTAHPYFEEIAELQVSSHLLIKRCGTCIQFVPFCERAWHAGVSSYKGRDNCNDYSVGIELEGTDEIPYTKEQYSSLLEITASLLKAYPKLTKENIAGHNDISPGRKTDPGESFDWDYYLSELELTRDKP